jgi:hypothetical protein
VIPFRSPSSSRAASRPTGAGAFSARGEGASMIIVEQARSILARTTACMPPAWFRGRVQSDRAAPSTTGGRRPSPRLRRIGPSSQAGAERARRGRAKSRPRGFSDLLMKTSAERARAHRHAPGKHWQRKVDGQIFLDPFGEPPDGCACLAWRFVGDELRLPTRPFERHDHCSRCPSRGFGAEIALSRGSLTRKRSCDDMHVYTPYPVQSGSGDCLQRVGSRVSSTTKSRNARTFADMSCAEWWYA